MPRVKVLLSGASGFIGQALAAQLAQQGYEVRALYRRPEAPAVLRELARRSKRVELVRGDLLEPLTIGAIVEGCSIVVHSAALAAEWGSLGLFREHNVEATRRLLEASSAGGVQRFVFISSAAVHGYGRGDRAHVATTEAGPYYPLKYPYQISKKEAEDLVLSKNDGDFTTVAIRPANVYGPGDVTSTYRMFDQVAGGLFGWLSGGRALTCPVYIEDLCAAVVAACGAEGLGGKAILVSEGSKVTWKDYALRMYELAGKGRKPANLPGPLATAFATACSGVWKLLRIKSPPPLTRYVVDQGRYDYHFANDLARELLGFRPKVGYREGLARTHAAWKSDRGL